MAAFLAAHLSKPVKSWFEVWCNSVKTALLQIGLKLFR